MEARAEPGAQIGIGLWSDGIALWVVHGPIPLSIIIYQSATEAGPCSLWCDTQLTWGNRPGHQRGLALAQQVVFGSGGLSRSMCVCHSPLLVINDGDSSIGSKGNMWSSRDIQVECK